MGNIKDIEMREQHNKMFNHKCTMVISDIVYVPGWIRQLVQPKCTERRHMSFRCSRLSLCRKSFSDRSILVVEHLNRRIVAVVAIAKHCNRRIVFTAIAIVDS